MIQALETSNLGKRYRNLWALQDCTLKLPVGRIAGLVGPNGAGKTTLLHLAVGLLAPTRGSIKVFGESPTQQAANVLGHVGFVAQDRPLYRGFSVQDMLTFGRKLNPNWDDDLAHRRLERLHIPLKQYVHKLSGGQQAQVALVLALARRPELLLLDEPTASLDPLARREFQQTLMDAVAEEGLTVLLSSHLVADLDRVCDYLIILSAAHVQIASDLEQIMNSHKWATGPRERLESLGRTHSILEAHESERHSKALVCTNGPILDPAWEVQSASLDDIVLAYLAHPALSLAHLEEIQQEVSR